jgi:RNA polymerase sigma-70 factor (ECF subfamily)
MTVATHLVIDQWRSTSRRCEVLTGHVPEATVEDMPQETVDRRLSAGRATEAVNRTPFQTYFFRGASVAKAAETRGVPPGTVKSRTHYAPRALRLAIDGMGVA